MKRNIVITGSLVLAFLAISYFIYQPPETPPFQPELALGAGGDTLFNDTFTDTAGTLLDAHTPNTGVQWTKIYDRSGSNDLEISASNTLIPESSGANAGAAYLASTTNAMDDHQIQFNCVDCGSGDELTYAIVRTQATLNQNNGGYILWDLTSSSGDDAKLSRVSGTNSCTQLDTIDEGQIINALWDDNTEVTFQAIGNEIAGFTSDGSNGVPVAYLYATDSNVSDGTGGIGMGALPCLTSGDFSTSLIEVDDFDLVEIADTSTSYNAPSTTGETDNDWTNPTNAYTDNGSYAEEDDVGGAQDYGDFGFSIPAGSTIRGIQVLVEAETGVGGSWAGLAIEVSNDNGSSWSSASSSGRYWDNTPADIYLFGHANSLWGLTWTNSDLDDTDFRIRLTHDASESGASNRDIEVDYVNVKVFYDEGVAPEETTPVQSEYWFD